MRSPEEAQFESVNVTGIYLHKEDQSGYFACSYIGFGSRTKVVTTNHPIWLGFGFKKSRQHGLAADIALGYLSGFPAQDIIWFLATRTLAPKLLRKKIFAWESRTGRYKGGLYSIPESRPQHLQEVLFGHRDFSREEKEEVRV